MAVFKIGLVGTGGIANGAHLPGIIRSPDLELTALCDIDTGRLNRTGDKYGIPQNRRFTAYKDLIGCVDVDAVDICTPNDVHFPVAMAAVGAKKPYYLEKPVTMNAADARTLADATNAAGLLNMVGFSYRFKTAARYARELVQTGALGEIYHANAQYFQAFGLPSAEAKLVWRFVRERAGSGALGDLGCHVLDLVRFILGKEYTKVVSDADTYVTQRELLDGSGTGVADVDDYCNYLCRMEGGVSASFQITRFGFGRGNYQRVEIYGGEGGLVYKLGETGNRDELELCLGKTMGGLHTYTKIDVPARCAADQMQSFADVLNGRGDGTTATIMDGLANQQAVDAIIESFENKKWVSLR